MNTSTLSELADIGAKAALLHVNVGGALAIEPAHYAYEDEQPAREAFAKAVLDAVGYKFSVDPEREAFERWLARQGADNKPDLFSVWQAGKASHTTTEPAKQPETFEAHGHTWFKHMLGDPMPVAGDVEVCVLCGDGNFSAVAATAGKYTWTKIPGCLGAEITGWRYADS